MQREPLVSIRDLAVEFKADAGLVHAVRGVSFDVHAGRTLAVVGESGSGKSVTANAILRLLPKRGQITRGSVEFRDPATPGSVVDVTTLDAESDAIRGIRGARIAMIFQEPMTSLSPLHTVGDQITEALRIHQQVPQEAANEAGISRMYGGIHFRAAIEKGLEQGRCIAQFAIGLRTRSST